MLIVATCPRYAISPTTLVISFASALSAGLTWDMTDRKAEFTKQS